MNNNTTQRNQNMIYDAAQMKTLNIIQEFKHLYEDKMRIIDAVGGGDCNVQAKIHLQQDWIRDLTDQNEMLVRAVEELEQEATERVLSLEEKLKQSSKCACEVMNGYKDISINLEETFQHNGVLRSDIKNLLEFINRVRDENSWDTDGLIFNSISKDELTGNGINSSGTSSLASKNNDKTSETLKEKDEKIKNLEKQLYHLKNDAFPDSSKTIRDATINTLRQSMLDMRDALTAEVADKHDVIVALRRDVQLLEEQCRKGDQQTHFKDDIIKELRKEIKQLKNEKEQECTIKIQELEEDNNGLRRTITKASEEIQTLQSHIEQYRNESHSFQLRTLKGEEKINSLEFEKSLMQQELEQLKEELCCQTQKAVDFSCCEKCLCGNEAIIAELKLALNKMSQETRATITTLTDENSAQCCTIGMLQESIRKMEDNDAQSSVKRVYMGQLTTSCKTLSRSASPVTESGQRSRSCSPKTISFSGVDVKVIKAVSPQFSRESSGSPASTDSAERNRKSCTEHPLTTVCLRARDCEVQEAKDQRIAELEQQVQKIDRKDEIIGIQNDTLTIVENELQAWRAKESEVEAARYCREREILNLKDIIDTLVKSLENEKKRSENLQKAVDLYLISISVLQESEEQAKEEISDQRVTITNLQEALVATKHTLDEYKQKTNQECDNLLKLIEKLRDENLILEVDLFYNHQDIEMYEMRVLKYQQLCRDLQGQCTSLQQEIKLYERQKVEQAAFIDELSGQLSECQAELKNLYDVLTQEQTMTENETMGLTNHIMTLQGELHNVNQKLGLALQCLEAEKKHASTLIYRLNVRECEFACVNKELSGIKEMLRVSTVEIATHKDRIAILHNKLVEYDKSIAILDKESEMCQENVQFCFSNLKDTKTKFERKCQELEVMKESYVRELNNGKLWQQELQNSHKCQAEEVTRFNQTVLRMQMESDKSNADHQDELNGYIEALNGLKVQLSESECKSRCLEQEVYELNGKLSQANEDEEKIQRDYKMRENDLASKLNHSEGEQERLIETITSLESRLRALNSELLGRNEQLSNMKKKIANMQNCNVDQIQRQNEEILNLKNEINTLIHNQQLLKEENANLQCQVAKFHTIVQKNDEKAKLMVHELNQCMAEIQTIQGDKEFLMQKNEQFALEVQTLQDTCQIKAESMVTLEMELNDTKNVRDTLCNESRNVINNVKMWLQEQRQINVELNSKIHQKNCTINKLNQEKSLLQKNLKQMKGECGSQGTYNRSMATPSCYTYGQSSPPPGTVWSAGSVESAGCSSDSEWDCNVDQSSSAPQVWIHRVESLTGKLQRNNRYWKNRMDEHDYTVSQDK